jgi:hypothetical protein
MEEGTTADKEGTTEERREGLIWSVEGGTIVDTVKKEPLSREGLIRSVEEALKNGVGETVLLGWQCGIEG